MGLKKNNPGCNCCGRVLVWAMGSMGGFLPSSTIRRAGRWYYNYSAGNQYELIFGEDRVHYAIPPSLLVPSTFGRDDFFWDRHPAFSPYGDHSEVPKFWTGNIHDYDLVIWENPYAASDLDTLVMNQVCHGFTKFTPVGEPDHAFFGGVPDWWDEVADGRWSGRVLMEVPELPTSNFVNRDGFIGGGVDGLDGHPVTSFLNTLSPVTGMQLDVHWVFNHAIGPAAPAIQVVANDLTADFAGGFSLWGTRVSGGEDVMAINAAFHDVPCFSIHENATLRDLASVQRNTITVEVGGEDYLKDFVMKTGRIGHDPDAFWPYGQDIETARPFYERCLTSPISNDHSLPVQGPS